MISPVISDDLHGVLSGASPIVSQWQRIVSMDQQSPNFLPLLSSLTTRDSRSSIVKLSRADAKVTLNIMDQASFPLFLCESHDLLCLLYSGF